MKENKQFHCIVCNQDYKRLHSISEHLDSVPYVIDDTKGICAYCTKKGYTICSYDKKTFNRTEIDYSKFYIYKDISDAPKQFYKALEFTFEHNNYVNGEFCCNKCFNLAYWKSNVVEQYLNKLKVEDLLGVRDLMKPLPGQKSINIPKISKEEIDILERYINSKIDYIKNNL
ncbi:hypothetical protein IAI10_20310 [Clostridium sp. 19966]|uniref:hypothetical protein n=1 Tax=Clostridium sp. 19966 TaxID=2768166 RepID=UPI0028DE6783|nr:hypothetical protein [Clostridium sp. 19966]MDT8719001.1 hypothetical protein [Clostridium sp. 19966]